MFQTAVLSTNLKHATYGALHTVRNIKFQQDKQCMYRRNIDARSRTIFAVKMQYVLHFLSVCL